MSAWTDLPPERLARVTETQRLLGISGQPPDPVGHRVQALNDIARASAERAWVKTMTAHADAAQVAWRPYAEQVAAHSAKQAAAKAKAESVQRKDAEQKAEELEERRANLHAAILVLAADSSASITAIRGEISAILEV